MAQENPFAYLLADQPQQQTSDNPFAHLLADEPKTAAPKPEVSATDAFGRGLTQSASFGFLDELAGTIAAGGAGPNENPAATIAALGRGAYRRLTGDPEAQQVAEAETARVRAENKQLEEGAPGWSLGGTLTGSVLAPGGIAARGVGWGAKALAAGATGAVQGGLTGLGEAVGSLGERLPGAAWGAGIGGVAGGVLSPALGVAGWGVRKILGPTISIGRGLRGVPAREEARRFVDVVGKDVAGTDVLSGAQADLARARGQPVMAIDQFGTQTRALARAAADASPEARGLMETELKQRVAERAPRMTAWLGDMSNYADPIQLKNAVQTVGSLENRPLYIRAYAQGDRNIGPDNPELNTLLSAPAVQDAMKASIHRWRDRQVAAGYGNLKSPIDIDPRTGEMMFTNSRGLPTYPNLQLWDYTARNLEATAARAREAGDRDTASLFGGFAQRLKSALDDEVPSFKDARASAAEFKGSENALDFGRKFFGASAKKDFREQLAAFEKLTPQQKAIAQDGYLPAFIDKVQRGESIKITPALKTEMETVLGLQKAAQVEDWVRVEKLMDESLRAVSGGSQTSRLLQDAKRWASSPVGVGGGVAGGTGFISGDYDPTNPIAIVSGLLAGAGSRRWNASNAAVMRQVAERLMSGDPAEYSKALQAMTGNPGLRRMLHEATDTLPSGPAALGRLTGTTAGRTTAEREQ